MAKNIVILPLFLAMASAACSQKPAYKIIKTFRIASSGGWDYLAVKRTKLYVSHGNHVNILDKDSGDSLGVIPNTNGVHGIAFINSINKGFTSNGSVNTVSVFNLQNDSVTGQISTGKNPDAIMYDSISNRVFTCNGISNDISVIDPLTEKVVATIPVGGKPETAVAGGNAKLYVNIEDKNEVVEIDIKTNRVVSHWPLKGGEEPTGLALDQTTMRLFAACNKLLVVLDANNGTIVAKVPIGEGCDGDVFDATTNNIYTSNGEGTMTIIHEEHNDKYKVTNTITTKRGARTIAYDPATNLIYLPTADFEKPKADAPENQRPKMIAGSFQVLVLEKRQDL